MSGTSPPGGAPSVDRERLARVLLAEWDTAADRLDRGQLPTEVQEDPELATVLAELATSRYDRHGRLLRFVLRLAPEVEGLHYRGTPLTPTGVAALAVEAVRAGPGSPADEVVRSLREQDVLAALADQTDDVWAGQLGRDWAAARRDAEGLLRVEADPLSRGQEAEVVDAMALLLLTDPGASARLRQQLQQATDAGSRPTWLRAALEPGSRVGWLLAAELLLPQVQRHGAAGPDHSSHARASGGLPPGEQPTVAMDPVRPSADPAADDRTVELPAVAPTGAHRAPGAVAVGAQGVPPAATGRIPAASSGAPSGPPSSERSSVTSRWWVRLSGTLVAPALALLVAAAGLRWPAATLVAVLVWFVTDRLVSVLTDPFLRLVGGWPPTLRGWAVLALPFRLLGVLLRGPWRLLGSVLLLVLWGVAVDRGLLLLHPLLAPWSATVTAVTPDAFAARWFVPVAAGGLVWLATRRRFGPPATQPGPGLRGAAALGAGLRALPGGLGGLLLLPAALLLWTAAADPDPEPWAPYADHREAIEARLPDVEWWSMVTDRLGTTLDRLRDVVPLPGGATPEDPTRWQVVGASALNVRDGPGTDQPVVAQLAAGEVVAGTGATETAAGATWVELQLEDGTTGWASARFLEEVAAEQPEAGSAGATMGR